MGAFKRFEIEEGTNPHNLIVGADGGIWYAGNRNGRIDPGDRVLLYVGLRRGGSSYYALDLSDPLAPRFLWRVTPEQPDYAELGLSFSTPRLGRLRVGQFAKVEVAAGAPARVLAIPEAAPGELHLGTVWPPDEAMTPTPNFIG